ncbi:Calcium-transporting ATPase [bioreactor metagenome]|uniref:Calcium-transporting ATPase n=1 Tax=bioreactor metagenome TaxID=1076179 RepID=A0A645IRV0_9ZZZZ
MKIISRGIILGSAALALYVWKLFATGNLMLARTLAVAQVAVSQFVHIFDCRIEDRTGKVSLFSNRTLLGAVTLSMGMVAAIIYLPALQGTFGTTGLSLSDWLIVAGASAGTAFIDVGARKIMQKFLPPEEDDGSSCKIVEPLSVT